MASLCNNKTNKPFIQTFYLSKIVASQSLAKYAFINTSCAQTTFGASQSYIEYEINIVSYTQYHIYESLIYMVNIYGLYVYVHNMVVKAAVVVVVRHTCNTVDIQQCI